MSAYIESLPQDTFNLGPHLPFFSHIKWHKRMTRKDFQIIANTLRAIKSLTRNDLHVKITEAIAKGLEKAYPRFDKNKFMEYVYGKPQPNKNALTLMEEELCKKKK